jgi:co-chaperonin GroES (HSP10)
MVMGKTKTIDKVKLVENNIMVHINVPKAETDSGIVLNKETARELQQTITGEVLHVGPDVTDFEVGDTILLPPHGHTAVAIDKEVYHIFRETSLFGKIEK